MSQAMTTRAGYEMAIAKARHRYAKVRADNQLMFAQESQFALMQIKRNTDLQEAAPDSLTDSGRGLSVRFLLTARTA